jgi:hypothetical protein
MFSTWRLTVCGLRSEIETAPIPFVLSLSKHRP